VWEQPPAAPVVRPILDKQEVMPEHRNRRRN
jgi:hypothetical protein